MTDKQDASQAGANPFVLTLPEVTETDAGYSDAEEANNYGDENGEDLSAGISVNKSAPESQTQSGEAQTDEEKSAANEGEKYRGMLDGSGKPFDPALHKYPPEKTPTGRWKKIPKSQREESTATVEDGLDYRAAAQQLATIYGTLHVLPFGTGGTIKKDELVTVIDAYERYMIENGIIQTPSGVDAILSSVLYSAGVAQRPGNIERVKHFMSSLWARFKGRKTKAKKPPPPKFEKKEEKAPPREEVKEPQQFEKTEDGDIKVPDILGQLDG